MLTLRKNCYWHYGILFIQRLQNTLQKVSKNIDNMLMSAEAIYNLQGFFIH